MPVIGMSFIFIGMKFTGITCISMDFHIFIIKYKPIFTKKTLGQIFGEFFGFYSDFRDQELERTEYIVIFESLCFLKSEV